MVDPRRGQEAPAPERPGEALQQKNDAAPQNNGAPQTQDTNQNAQTYPSGEPKVNQKQANLSLFQRISNSFMQSVGQIVFGMEDGTVSIFGLVFGLAATANNSQAVFLAGATGAAAAAVSMMAGAFLDVESTRAMANADIEEERQEIKNRPQEEAQEITDRLSGAGFNQQQVQTILGILKKKPKAMLKFETAYELQIGNAANENPFAQAAWMFLADLIAASIPVIPFALFPIATARWVSIGITGLLLIILGITRAKVANGNYLWTTLETLLIAALAAGAGVGIGMLIHGGGAAAGA